MVAGPDSAWSSSWSWQVGQVGQVVEVGQGHDGAGAPRPALPDAGEGAQHVVGRGELAQVALAGPDHELDVGQQRGGPVGLVDGHEGVGVAVPPVHGHADVGQAETPGAPEEDEVVDDGLAVATGAAHEVVDDHRLDVGVAQHALVPRRQDAGEGLEGEAGDGRGHPDQAGQPQAHRPADEAQRLVPLAGQGDQALGQFLVVDRRHHRAHHGDGHHPRGQVVRAGQRVGAAAREADHHEAVVTQAVGHDGDVVTHISQLRVRVVGRVPDAGTFEADDAEAEALGGPPSHEWDLAPRARGAVEPEDERTGGVTELGVAEPSAVGQGYGALDLGRWAGRNAEDGDHRGRI